MAVPTTRAEFKEYCLRKLGKPVIETNVDDDQVEEFFCEMFAKYGRSLLQIADSVVKHYKK